jgi:hypothetical protein
MTSRDRPDSRRDYRHFPAAYGEVFHRFAERDSAVLGPMSERDARAALRDLYRFRTFLSHACDTDPSDAFARELLTISRDATMRVEPLVSPVNENLTHVVTLTLNPIVAAMRAVAQTEEATS